MDKKDACIYDLYLLLQDIADKAKNNDFSLFKSHSVGGTGIYHGAPPIIKIFDDVTDKHGDAISCAMRQKEREEVLK